MKRRYVAGVSLCLCISLSPSRARSIEVDTVVGGLACGAALIGLFAHHLYRHKHGGLPKAIKKEFKKIGLLQLPINWVVYEPIRGEFDSNKPFVLGFHQRSSRQPSTAQISYLLYLNHSQNQVQSIKINIRSPGTFDKYNKHFNLINNFVQDIINELNLSREDVQALMRSSQGSFLYIDKASFSKEKDFHFLVREIIKYRFIE